MTGFFPNQDYHSKKGLGNLIALPLNKTSLSNGNSCFIDPETLQPFDDQWAFLKTINRITISQLNYIYKEQTNQDELSTGLFQKEQPITGKLAIVLRNEIHLSRIGLPVSLVVFLKEELNLEILMNVTTPFRRKLTTQSGRN